MDLMKNDSLCKCEKIYNEIYNAFTYMMIMIRVFNPKYDRWRQMREFNNNM